MYVAELDRPWLGTPFLLQGFLIESEREISLLQQFCFEVIVDRTRSIGDAFAPRVREKDPAKQTPLGSGGIHGMSNGAFGRGAAGTTRLSTAGGGGAVASDDFLAIARRLREDHEQLPREHGEPLVKGHLAQLPLEAELLCSAPIIDDVHRALGDVREAIDNGTPLDLDRLSGLINELAAGVERNPDAMLWLTRLRRTDQYSYDHAVDVAVHLMVFSRFLGFSSGLIEDIGFSGLMQDIGKMQLAPDLLAKPSALTDDEYEQIKSHVASSLRLLVNKPQVNGTVLEIVGAHHERFDGSGYPRSIGGDSLRLPCEMAGLIDTYCAMTRHRSYSAAVSSQRALESLVKLRGAKFRETMVDQFIQCLGIYPIGSLVELNTGEVAVVIQQNQVRRLKPKVLILLAEDKSIERKPRSLELLLEPKTPTGEPYRIRNSLPPDAYGIDPRDFYLD